MKNFSRQQEEEKPQKSLLINQIHLQQQKEKPKDIQASQNADKRKSVKLFEKFQTLKKIKHNNLFRYIDLREQKQLQNRYLIFQEANDCSIQDLAFRRSQNGMTFTEVELIQIAFSILKGIIYLQEKHNIEVGFFTPNQVYYTGESNSYKINNYGQFYLDAYSRLPENLEDLMFKPPEYFILGAERAKHGEFCGGKGEIWSLGILMRYCMTDCEPFVKEEDLMKKYLIPTQGKTNNNQEKKKNFSKNSNVIQTASASQSEHKRNRVLASNKDFDESSDQNRSSQQCDNDHSKNKNLDEDNENILQTDNFCDTEEPQEQFQYKVDRIKFIEDMIAISADERYHETSAFLLTPYQLPYLNPFQEYLNGFKCVSNQYSFEFRSFVSQCLFVNPLKRQSALQLICHPIFKQLDSLTLNETNETTPNKNQSNNKSLYENDQDELNEENLKDIDDDYDSDQEAEDEDLEKILRQEKEDEEDSEDQEEANRVKSIYNMILYDSRNKRVRLNKAYDDVVKKGNMNNIEDLFPLEIVIDIINNEIETNILSQATIGKSVKKQMFSSFLFNCSKSVNAQILRQSNQINEFGIDNYFTLRIDCKPIYQHIVNEISYYSNVLKSVKELQTLAEYLGLYSNNQNQNSFKEKAKSAKHALNINTTLALEQSQFLNSTLMLNESTIYQNNDYANQGYSHQPNNLNLSTILNDPDLSMCIQPSQQMSNRGLKGNQQIIDPSILNDEYSQTTSVSTNASTQKQQQAISLNSKQKEQQNEQQKVQQQQPIQQQQQQQQQQDLDKSSTSISFGFFKKMKISEKVSKFWGSKNEGQTQSGSTTNSGQTSTPSNNKDQANQKQIGGGGSSTGITQVQPSGTPANNVNNDLFANISQDLDGEFQPYPNNMVMPNTSISQKIKEYLFYMNLLYEDRRIVSPKQIPQYLIQVELPILLRPELYKKVIVIPTKAAQLFKLLVSVPLIYRQKQGDLKQIDNDLPRCHQYTDFCSSHYGQKQISDTLSAFLNLHSNYYYLQGMDAMAFVSLQTSPNNSPATALLILQDVVKKSLLMHQSSQQSPEDYIMKEKLLLYKWLLRLEDPQLSDYLEEKQFYPEIYAISWFLNLFSMVFDIQTVLKIWDFIICDSNFSLCFAVSLMIELKDYLMMKDSNELMTSIRNLEGVINTKNCWKYAQYLMKTLPETFLTLNYIQNENERNDYQKEFFVDCPWEIPPMYSILSKRPIFYASIFDLLKQKHVIYIDIRSKEEYETVCLKNSLYAHFINGRVNEVVLSYLEKKSNKLTNFENFEESQANDFMSLIVIVFNYDKQQDMLDAVNQFLSVGVRKLVVLNGGIQCIQRDRPDLLEYKHRIHPINYYKRKQQ